MTITIDDKNYELKMSIGRVQQVERKADKPIALILLGNNGMISFADMALIYGWCLLPEGADAYVSPKEGAALFEKDLEQRGYAAVNKNILEAAKESLPFLFKMS